MDKKLGYQHRNSPAEFIWTLKKGTGNSDPQDSMIAEKPRRDDYPKYYIRYDIDEWGRVVT